MQHPEHRISNTRKRLTPERIAGLAFGGLIPAVFIWALIAGLIPQISIPIVRDINTRIIKDKVTVDQPPAGPVIGRHIDTAIYHPPVFDTFDDHSRTITLPPGTGGGNGTVFNPDQGPRAIGATHTTPPYPSVEARLGRQGTVTLLLAIDASGAVTDAQVVSSSGSDGLDQAAIAWVKTHWRYQPATHDGVAVAATTKAAIRFDLRDAMR